MIHSERVQTLKGAPERPGRYVLYWMQQAQRAEDNHALEYALSEGNARGLPVVVVFGLTADYPEANARHYAFLLEGLREVDATLRERGIRFVVRRQDPPEAALGLAGEAALLVTDRGYLRIQTRWRRRVAERAPCPVVQVETDAVVPVAVVSEKEAYAARTIRPRISRHLDAYLVPVKEVPVGAPSVGMAFDGLDVADPEAVLRSLPVDRSVPPVTGFRGGTGRAKARLERFLETQLAQYAESRNDPALGIGSRMSPYLHFGQVSALYVALRVRAEGAGGPVEAYLEELIVRRELSLNFVTYNPDYDAFEGLPEWARRTLDEHADDPRESVYEPEALEAGETHDPYWNAAQREMVLTGKMHNYMRMYWGKKILEWTRSPREAFRTALCLNNKYELDGRDANSYAGVAWCFGKHDRPWQERPVFGKVRYMNANGLRRKFDIEAYVQRVQALR